MTKYTEANALVLNHFIVKEAKEIHVRKCNLSEVVRIAVEFYWLPDQTDIAVAAMRRTRAHARGRALRNHVGGWKAVPWLPSWFPGNYHAAETLGSS